MPKVKAPTKALEYSTNFQMISLDLIEPNPWQPRLTFEPETIRMLAASIKESALQQYPAGRALADGKVQLAFGEQRLRAFQQLAAEDASYSEMPILIREYSDQEMAIAAMEENRSRKDLTPIEEAKAWKRMMDEFNLGPTELGQTFKLDKSTISYAVHVLDLPEAVLAKAEEMGMALGAMRELLCLQGADHAHEEAMLYILGEIDEHARPEISSRWRTRSSVERSPGIGNDG